jgi:ABC-type proline/glycine betaine transport system permease subunit
MSLAAWSDRCLNLVPVYLLSLVETCPTLACFGLTLALISLHKGAAFGEPTEPTLLRYAGLRRHQRRAESPIDKGNQTVEVRDVM